MNQAPRVIQAWKARVSAWARRLAELRQCLDEDELARAERRAATKREQFLVAHGLLRQVLGRESQRPPASLRFGHAPAGKPFLAGPAEAPELEFSLSHSGDLVLIAVSLDLPLGVDVEQGSKQLDPLRLAQRFFSPAEQAQLVALPSDQQLDGFLACWTRKEAYLKATGAGVSGGLSHFDVTLAPDQPARLLVDRRVPGAAQQWRILDVPAEPGYRAALVVASSGSELRCHELEPG